MIARLAIVVAALLAAVPARAEILTPEAARRFVAGKLFAFNCFDGSRGAGRIYGDGSVIGTIQFRGSGPVRAVWLPAGARRVGMRVAARHGVRAVFSSREARRAQLPRLVDGLCLLRLHAPHERCRGEPAPAFVRVVAARGEGGRGRELTEAAPTHALVGNFHC